MSIDAIETAFAVKGTWTGRSWDCDSITPEMSDVQIVRAHRGGDLRVTSWGYVNADARIAAAFQTRCQRALERLDAAEGDALAEVCEALRALARLSDALVARDAAAAEECAAAAVEAARAGNLSEARQQAEQAAMIERAYGATPTWGPLLAAIRSAEEAEEADET